MGCHKILKNAIIRRLASIARTSDTKHIHSHPKKERYCSRSTLNMKQESVDLSMSNVIQEQEGEKQKFGTCK